MSQNSHKLLLFFDDAEIQKDCLLMLLRFREERYDEAAFFASKLNIDVVDIWRDDWFNQELSAKPEYLCLYYDSSTHYQIPYDFLRQLFSCGLTAAALETFYSQVGETEHAYFHDDKLLPKKHFLKAMPSIEAIIDDQFDLEFEDEEQVLYAKPTTLQKIQPDEEKNARETREFVDGLTKAFRDADKEGVSAGEMVQGFMFLFSLGKAALVAVVFAIVTMVLFDGFWLWLLLSLVVLIVLTFWFFSREIGDATGGEPEQSSDNEDEDSRTQVSFLPSLVKGAVYAAVFGVVTVLLFKGFWLWISLSILLLFVMPIWFYGQQVGWFDDDDSETDGSDEGEDNNESEVV